MYKEPDYGCLDSGVFSLSTTPTLFRELARNGLVRRPRSNISLSLWLSVEAFLLPEMGGTWIPLWVMPLGSVLSMT